MITMRTWPIMGTLFNTRMIIMKKNETKERERESFDLRQK
jgi:hypothetical protein